MSRPLRRAVADGWYHVFGRGMERRDIFGGDADRTHFLELLAGLHERYRIRIHAYALMDNHYHAIFQTPEANLSAGMQWFHGSYSAWFNTRRQRVGPLFQGRYGCVPVEDGRWAYELSRYVHLNPLRIGSLGLDRQGRVMEARGWKTPTPEEVRERLQKLRTYRWSSYRAYGGYTSEPPWLETGELLRRSHKDAVRWRAAYRRDVRDLLIRGVEACGVKPWRDAVAIGTAEFAQKVRAWAAGKDLRGISQLRALRRRASVDDVRRALERLKGSPWEAFADRRGDAGLALFLWAARRLCGLTLWELGRGAGGMSEAAVSKAISRLECQARQNKALRAQQQELLEMSYGRVAELAAQ